MDKRLQWAVFFLYFFIFVVIWTIEGLGDRRNDAPTFVLALVGNAVFTLAIIAVGLLTAVLAHELGHLVVGRLAGFEFRSLSVGPVEARLELGRLHFARTPSMRGIGGLVRMVPVRADGLERRITAYIAGGPLASALWCAAAYGIFQATIPQGERSLAGWYAYSAALGMFVMSLSVLPGTLLPFKARNGSSTDMKVLLSIWGGAEERGRQVALFLLSREILSAVRARDWSPHLLERARVPEDGSDSHIRALLLLYYFHLDRGDFAQARDRLEEARPHAERLKPGDVLREAILLEVAFTAVWFDYDLDEARELFREAGEENELLAGTRARTYAAIAFRTGDMATALSEAEKAEPLLRQHAQRYGGNPSLDLDLLELVRGEIAANAPSSGTDRASPSLL